MSRQPILTAVVGKKGVGKTFKTLQILHQYVQGSVNGSTFQARRVLILDVNDEFETVKSIDLENVAWFSFHQKVDIRRVRPYKANGKKMSLDEVSAALSFILENFKFGLLLVEDINKYVSDSIGKDLLGGIVTLRHYDCDIIMHFQTIGKVGNPKILGNLNILRMHKTGDTVDRHVTKFEDKYEIIKIAETIVGYKYRGTELDGKFIEPNARFFLYVNFDTEKITGEFNRREAERAVREYLWVNESNVIKPMLRMRNEAGQFIFPNDAIAMKSKLAELMSLYFIS